MGTVEEEVRVVLAAQAAVKAAMAAVATKVLEAAAEGVVSEASTQTGTVQTRCVADTL